jgi:hypothetical protein
MDPAEGLQVIGDDDTKTDDIDTFKAGLDVDLMRKMESGNTLRDDLSVFLGKLLDTELRNQEERLEDIERWERQYRGIKDDKSFPFPECANTCHPISRSNVDTIEVRAIDALCGKRKMAMIKAINPQKVDQARKLEDAIDWYSRHTLDIRNKLRSPINEAIKTGTGFIKVGFENRKRVAVRYATEEELNDKSITKYKLRGTKQKAVKYIQTLYKGPNIYPLKRSDVVFSSDARTVEDAYMFGFKKKFRKPELEVRVKKGDFYAEEVDLITQPDEKSEIEKQHIESQGKGHEQIEAALENDIHELWVRYDVDDEGEEEDIVCTFHRESGAILRCIYNPIFAGFRPFIPIVFYPSNYSLEGQGVCEILENIQEEIDTVHNQRLDRITQINAPMTLVRGGSGLDDFEISPGKTWVVDDDLESVLREVTFSDQTFSNAAEEDRLVAMGNLACGLSDANKGMSSSERPVFKETATLIGETNKKFKAGHDNLRRGVTETYYQLIEFFAQYQPTYVYKKKQSGPDGKPFWTSDTVQFPLSNIRDAFEVELMASDDVFDQETRREVNIAIYHMLSEHMTSLAQMAEAVTSLEVPSEFKKFLISGAAKQEKIITRILEDFDQKDAEQLVLKLEETIDVEKAIQMSADNPEVQQMMQGGQQGPPQAPPGAEMVPSQELMG